MYLWGRIMTLYSRNVQTYYSLEHDIKRNECHLTMPTPEIGAHLAAVLQPHPTKSPGYLGLRGVGMPMANPIRLDGLQRCAFHPPRLCWSPALAHCAAVLA